MTQVAHFLIKQLYENLQLRMLTLFRMGIFRAAHGWGVGGKKLTPSLPKICNTYHRLMKLGTVIPYLKKIQKIYGSRDTLADFC